MLPFQVAFRIFCAILILTFFWLGCYIAWFRPMEFATALDALNYMQGCHLQWQVYWMGALLACFIYLFIFKLMGFITCKWCAGIVRYIVCVIWWLYICLSIWLPTMPAGVRERLLIFLSFFRWGLAAYFLDCGNSQSYVKGHFNMFDIYQRRLHNPIFSNLGYCMLSTFHMPSQIVTSIS